MEKSRGTMPVYITEVLGRLTYLVKELLWLRLVSRSTKGNFKVIDPSWAVSSLKEKTKAH